MKIYSRLGRFFLAFTIAGCTTVQQSRIPAGEQTSETPIDLIADQHFITVQFYSDVAKEVTAVVYDDKTKTNFVVSCNVPSGIAPQEIQMNNLLNCKEQKGTRVFANQRNADITNSYFPYLFKQRIVEEYGADAPTANEVVAISVFMTILTSALLTGSTMNAMISRGNIENRLGSKFAYGGFVTALSLASWITLFGVMAAFKSAKYYSLEEGTRRAIDKVKTIDDATKLRLQGHVHETIYRLLKESLVRSFAQLNEA